MPSVPLGVKRGTGQPHRIETPDGFKKGPYESMKVTGTRETKLAYVEEKRNG